MLLHNNLVKLRAVEPEDLEYFYIWENDTNTWQVSNTLVPFSRFALTQFIQNTLTTDIFEAKQVRLMIDTLNNATIGSIDLFDYEPYHRRAGVGILIDANWRKKGYAKAALNLLIEYTFNILNLRQLYCNISEHNHVSIKLFTSVGFQITGTKKQWNQTSQGYADEHFLQLIAKTERNY